VPPVPAAPAAPSRAILHVDMDAFYAAVEQLDHPELRGKPVLVGSTSGRGVVMTASYEARPFGCHSAQPMAVAMRLCPHALVVPTRMWRYQEVSDVVFDILHEFTPLVEPLSIDEAFLDVTGSLRLFGSPLKIARTLKERIHKATGVTASVGVAPNKFLAKLASDLEKPDGLTVIDTDNIDRVLPPLPVSKLWGVGPKTAQRLEGMAVHTFGDIRKLSPERLQRLCGVNGEHYYRLAHGLDDREVTPDGQAKSIGQEETFGENLTDPQAVRDVMLAQAEQVGSRLRRHRLRARGVTVKIRFGAFKTITRAATLPAPTDLTADLWNHARATFDRWATREFQPVRLIGVSANRLTRGGEQLDLFDAASKARARRLDGTLDRINARFGRRSIHRSGETE
jgi:DNA polymerase IV